MKLAKIIPITFIFLIFLLYLLNRTPQKPLDFNPDDYLLIFTSPSCPHCQTVKDYIGQNDLSEKLSIKVLDLSQNQQYSTLLADKAKSCQIDTSQIGVPFYFYQGQCLQGDQPIISALDQMLK